MTRHGTIGGDLAPFVPPRSSLHRGFFGRLFRNLSPHEEAHDALVERAREMTDQDRGPSEDNREIPAGYTYFGQFVDHDLTFDPTSSLTRRNDPDRLHNFRTPRFDLDSLYGAGPEASPFLYDNKKEKRGFLLIGKGRNVPMPMEPTIEDDLPRNEQGIALTGDPRNDENIIISQLHLAFIKFHNRILARDEVDFEEAQRIVRWHYQWVVRHDFLERLVDREMIDSILPETDDRSPGAFRFRFYRWRHQPFMPVEFSVAAYRFGHSMIRDAYALSDGLGRVIDLFDPAGHLSPLLDLRGGRFLPKVWTVQWDRFVRVPGSPPPQFSLQIDTRLSPALTRIPHLDPADLALRDLIRGQKMELPSGQDVARAMGLDPIRDENPVKGRDRRDADPLWYYILREAKEESGGIKLGSVGQRIIAEVFIGLLVADRLSYLRVDPNWRPDKSFMLDPNDEAFELKDILHHAGVPLTAKKWKEHVG